jgi:hypothetical protein
MTKRSVRQLLGMRFFIAFVIVCGVCGYFGYSWWENHCWDEGEAKIRLVTIKRAVLLDGDEIHSYEWSTHTIKLKEGMYRRFLDRVFDYHKENGESLVLGLPFVFEVNGEECYSGRIMTSLSSCGFNGPAIVYNELNGKVDVSWEQLYSANQLTIDNGYVFDSPKPKRDLRNNNKVRCALLAIKKLK